MHILSSRFTNETWEENQSYRMRYPNIQCVYGTPQPITAKIDIHEVVCVVEMNNTTNKIVGIGMVRNTPYIQRLVIYNTNDFNQYVFVGKYRLERDEVPQDVVNALDYVLFKEKTHMKRGAGVTMIPEKLLRHERCNETDIIGEIVATFRKKYRDATGSTNC